LKYRRAFRSNASHCVFSLARSGFAFFSNLPAMADISLSGISLSIAAAAKDSSCGVMPRTANGFVSAICLGVIGLALSKWDFVVNIACRGLVAQVAALLLLTAARVAARSVIGIATATAAATVTAAAASVQQYQHGTKTLQHDFGAVLVGPGLILPFPGLQFSFKVNLGAFAQIPFCDANEAVLKYRYANPFRALALLARAFVFPGFRSGDAQVAHFAAVLKGANLGITAQIA
jgi:hypothetical protein